MTENIRKTIMKIEDENDVKVVYLSYSGSKLYGTHSKESDTDYKGIFIPSHRDILLKKDKGSISFTTGDKHSKNSKDDIDFTLHSVYDFFSHLKKSETGAIDLLFSMWATETIVLKDQLFIELIKANYSIFLNSNMKSFIGYALGQSKKFGIKGAKYKELDSFFRFLSSAASKYSDNEKLKENLWGELKEHVSSKNYTHISFLFDAGPKAGNSTAEEIEYISILGKKFHSDNKVGYFVERVGRLYKGFGNRTKTVASTEDKIDYKALSHAYRVALETQELLETGFIQFPLKDAKFIKDIKYGKIDAEKVINEIETLLERVDNLILKSELPKKADSKKVDELLLLILYRFSKNNSNHFYF